MKYEKSLEKELNSEGLEKEVLLSIEWPNKGIYNDGKQSNTLTGAAHPGCCKQ